jgi:3-deoxy-manno-octulosonate cytidylyltransferase (CMP-KDO synthetase)
VKILGVIPARYGSTRFPGKPLHPIAGKPLVQHVVERCRGARALAEVIVATDDARIADAVRPFCRVEMTRPDHPSGTDRIAEVAGRVACDAVVNIQGDEPLLDPAVIDAVAATLADAEMTTAAAPVHDPAELDNPNVVKVVLNAAGRALYFSRHPIPYLRDLAGRAAGERARAFPYLKHLGLYGYRRDTLLRLVRWPVSPLEAAEKLEQLRALEHGLAIAVVRVAAASPGVDTPEDAARVERLLRAGTGGVGG